MQIKPMMIGMMLLMLISLFFIYQGISMHSKVSSEEESFHGLQQQYFSLDKATRESAPTDSVLSQQLVDIMNYPSELMRLKLLGVGKILTGIYILLFGILIALIMMPMRLAQFLQQVKPTKQKRK